MDVSMVSSCLKVCSTTLKLLLTAKNNKKECSSLATLVRSVELFLHQLSLCERGLSVAAVIALGHVKEVLSSSQGFLARVANTGPLVSLLSADSMRDDFTRLHRDLSSAFSVLGAGESLVRCSEERLRALQDVEGKLASSRALFTQQELVSTKLHDITEADRQQPMHPEMLHSQLLQQLQQLEEVTALSPEELWAELQALQVAAKHGWDLGGLPDKGKGHLGAQTEELLVDHLCAALAPKAAKAGKPISHPSGLQVPEEYLCPIGGSIMVQPVILCDTGHTFEAANIQRWLQLNNTCPISRKQLAKKDLKVNWALLSAIHKWAAAHGMQLPPAPEFKPLTGTADAAAGGAADQGRVRKQCRCTRTSWAVAIMVSVLVVAAIIGTGVGLGVRNAAAGVAAGSTGNAAAIVIGGSPSPAAASTPATSPTPATSDAQPTGSGPSRSIPVEPGESPAPSKGVSEGKWVAVSAGQWHTCGILSQGRRLRCWGANDDNKTTVPADVAASSTTQVSAGSSSTCAVLSNGKLRCWGRADTSAVPYTYESVFWSAVSVGGLHSCGILKDTGRLVCWGGHPVTWLNNTLPTNDVNTSVDLSSWVAVSAGSNHTCGITSDQLLRCWGDNRYKQVSVPEDEVASAWAAVSAGEAHTCGILLASQRMLCWGSLGYKREPATVPANVARASWVAVSAGGSFTCGILQGTNRLVCWGFALSKETAVPADVAAWQAVSAGLMHTCGIASGSGELLCWGGNTGYQATVPRV